MSALTTAPRLEDDPEVARLLQRLGGTTDPPPVGFWDGALSATAQGAPRGVLEAKATLEQAVGGAMDVARSVGDSINFSPDQASYEAGLGDAGFERFQQAEAQYQEDTAGTAAKVAETQRAAAEYRPDPLATGLAGQIGNEFAALIPRTVGGTVAAGPGGGAVAAGLPAGQAEAARLEAQGVDPTTASTVGGVTGVATAAGVALPGAGIVKGPLLDTALAALGNAGLGAAERGTAAKALRDAGYTEQAAQYDALDRTALAADVGLSLLFSGAHHLTTPKDAAALLTARNADHFARGDGLVPVDGRSAAVADRAKSAAVDALHRGETVATPSEVADAAFVADPFRGASTVPPEVHQAARDATPTADLYEATAERIVQLESGGRADARNPRSSATGAGQFIDATWLELVRRHRPDLAAYKTTGEILALRTDPELSAQMVAQLARDNGAALEAAGLPVTPQNLYAAHHFGQDGGLAFARADDATPMAAILSAGKLRANPYLADLTKGELLANWAKRGLTPPPQTARPQIDLPSEPSRPFYDMSREELEAQRESVRAVGDTIERTILGNDLDAWRKGQRMQNAYDSKVSDEGSRIIAEIEARLTPADRDALYGINLPDHLFDEVDDFITAHSDGLVSSPDEAATVLGRQLLKLGGTEGNNPAAWPREQQAAYVAMRTVRERIEQEGWDSAAIQRDAIQRAGARYASRPEDATFMLDRFLKRAETPPPSAPVRPAIEGIKQRALPPPVEKKPGLGAKVADFVSAVFRPAEPETVPPAAPRQVRAELPADPQVTAALQVAQQAPDHPILAGYDADGAPVFRTLAEAMDELHADYTAATREADAYTAGANCYLRREIA